MARDRRRAYLLGRHAETLCAWWLRLRGYRILIRDYRTAPGEIDIVARRGATLALVEVKARPSVAEAAWAITPRQKARIERAAARLLQERPELSRLSVRFDAMLVAPGRLPVHLTDAWRPDA
jgi:putative endonuclease